jgi:hypothetical protein
MRKTGKPKPTSHFPYTRTVFSSLDNGKTSHHSRSHHDHFHVSQAIGPAARTCFLHVIVSCSLPRVHSTGSELSIFAPRLCNTGHYECREGHHHTTQFILSAPSPASCSKNGWRFKRFPYPVPTRMAPSITGHPLNMTIGYLPTWLD